MTTRRIEAFVRRVGAVPEQSMRIALWRERFDREPPEVVVETLLHLFVELDRGRVGAQAGYLALTQHASDRGVDARVEAVLALTDDDRLRAVFVHGTPQQIAHPQELRTPPLSRDREISLGERRTLARRHDRDLLTRLLFDRDPQVISNLLQNPRILERDVLRIASRRPADAAVLQVVFRHPRWSRRRTIQFALVSNPYAPLEVACGLVGLMDRETARRVSQEPSLHAEVRAAALRRLEGRST